MQDESKDDGSVEEQEYLEYLSDAQSLLVSDIEEMDGGVVNSPSISKYVYG